MTDPAATKVKGRQKPNLTIKNMLERPNVKALAEYSLLESLSVQIHDRVDSEKFRQLRNEYISHLDLDFMENLQVSDFSSPNKAQIEEITNLIYGFYDLLGRSLFRDTKLPAKKAKVVVPNGAGTLIIKLQDYRLYEQVLKKIGKAEGVPLRQLIERSL